MLFLQFLLTAVYSAIFGIDFGCEYTKIGMAKPGQGIHVALNQQSKRLSPSYFAFWNISNPQAIHEGHWKIEDIENCNWAYLDSAKSHSLRFPKNAVKGITDMLNNDVIGFTKREITALLARHLISIIDDGKWSLENAKVVVTVEPLLKRSERLALIDALNLANLSISAIVDSPTAAAQVYALEKRSLYLEKEKTVLFIDVGATSTWAAIFKFENKKDNKPIVSELSIATNYSLGGNLMDSKLADLLLKRFAENNKIEIPKNDRIVRRFVEEARRAKEILSMNKAVDIQIEDVVEDYGIHYHLTRDEFESLLDDFNNSLQIVYNNALLKANLTSEDLDSIELIGGVSRVPLVKNVLKQLSGMEKLNRTMNSDEVVALGAGYVGASKSGSFMLKKAEIDPFANTNVTIYHNGKITHIFNETSRLNETYVYQYNASANGNISIYADKLISSFNFTLPENTTNDTPVKIVFGFDDFTIPCVKIILVNDTFIHPSLTKFIKPSYLLSNEEMTNSTSFINKMDSVLIKRREYQKIRNDYESYIYRIKDKLEYDNVYRKVVSEKERQNITEIVENHTKWLFSSTNSIPLQEIKKQLKELKTQTKAIRTRAQEYVKRAPAFLNLNKTINMVYKSLKETWPVTKPWLTAEQLETLWGTFNRTKNWFIEKYSEQKNRTETDDPAVRYSEIDTQRMILEWSYNTTNRIPKPTPTPKPTPVINATTPETNSTSPETNSTSPESNTTIPESNTTIPESNTTIPESEIDTEVNGTSSSKKKEEL